MTYQAGFWNGVGIVYVTVAIIIIVYELWKKESNEVRRRQIRRKPHSTSDVTEDENARNVM